MSPKPSSRVGGLLVAALTDPAATCVKLSTRQALSLFCVTVLIAAVVSAASAAPVRRYVTRTLQTPDLREERAADFSIQRAVIAAGIRAGSAVVRFAIGSLGLILTVFGIGRALRLSWSSSLSAGIRVVAVANVVVIVGAAAEAAVAVASGAKPVPFTMSGLVPHQHALQPIASKLDIFVLWWSLSTGLCLATVWSFPRSLTVTCALASAVGWLLLTAHTH